MKCNSTFGYVVKHKTTPFRPVSGIRAKREQTQDTYHSFEKMMPRYLVTSPWSASTRGLLKASSILRLYVNWWR
jgi:hypothetical protein